jgi:hypothetical protein
MNYPFKQGENHLNILYTRGYNTPDKADELRPTHLWLGKINEVHVEYRYLGVQFQNLYTAYPN